MNWAAIHALVQEIPKTFRDPSFSNSGRQISLVVTASDPARELEQVKAVAEQRAAVCRAEISSPCTAGYVEASGPSSRTRLRTAAAGRVMGFGRAL